MAAPIKKATSKAVALLQMPHPKHPKRTYTIAEAAKKTGVARSTIYRHIEKHKGEQNV